jgi:hypothetical protein
MRWRIAPLRAAGLLIVLGINAGLLVSIATQATSDHLAAADKAAWNANLSGAVANATNRKQIESYGQILTRPVFFRSREPFVPAPAPPPPALIAAPPLMVVDPGLVLGGVMMKNDVRKAYVSSIAGASGAWTSEGDEFMGWRIRSISRTGAKLEQGGRSIDLQLYPQD